VRLRLLTRNRIDWGLTALSTQAGYIVPTRNGKHNYLESLKFILQLIKSSDSLSTVSKVETFVAVVGAGPLRKQIETWIIILAIVGGCLLLFLIVIILWKVRNVMVSAQLKQH